MLSEVMAHFPTLLNTQKGSCLCVMVHIGQTVCLIRMWGRYWRHACMLQARAQLPVTLVLGMSISVAALRHMLPVKAADLLQAKEFRLVQVHILDHGLTSCMHTRQLLADAETAPLCTSGAQLYMLTPGIDSRMRKSSQYRAQNRVM